MVAARCWSGGVGCVVATRGPDGAVIVDADGSQSVPAFEVEVVDTTGCGDAFSAALVAQGLGSDHGDFDLAAADAFAA